MAAQEMQAFEDFRSSRSSFRAGAVRNLWLLFLSLSVVFGVCEAGYRAFLVLQKPLYRPSSVPHLGWEYNPGAFKTTRGEDHRLLEYFINRQGFRDRACGAWERWRPEDVKIAFLGDSVTAGAEVNYEESYPALVESLLNVSGKKTRTLNAGLDATNTLQHLAALRYKVLGLGPDIVVLGYFANDVEERAVERLPEILQAILRKSYFADFLIYRAMAALRNVRAAHGAQSTAQSETTCPAYAADMLGRYSKADWLRNEKSLAEMAALCRRAGVRFGIAAFPFKEQLSGRCPLSSQKRLEEFCRRYRIPFLDMAKVFAAYPPESLYAPGDDIHPNRHGHQVAAEALSRWLLDLIKPRQTATSKSAIPS